MHLTIITPETTVLQSDGVEHVLLPAENGEVGVLPGHIAMMCNLQVGRIHADLAGRSVRFATSGGFAEVLSDHITVLAETAEQAEQIDVERAGQARDRARQRLRRRDDETIDFARAQAALSRALNRLRIAEEP